MSTPEKVTPQIAAVEAIMAAWRDRRIEPVLDRLHDDIEFTYAIGKRPMVGKERIRGLLEFLQTHQRDVQWRTVHRAQTGDVVFVEGVDDFVNPDGHHVRTPHVTVFEFEGDEVIRWRDYYDQRQMEAAEAGEPSSEWLLPLVAPDRGRR
ncbi:MAG: nuclear transport factor 2 family protein [Actinomycetota bacterium]